MAICPSRSATPGWDSRSAVAFATAWLRFPSARHVRPRPGWDFRSVHRVRPRPGWDSRSARRVRPRLVEIPDLPVAFGHGCVTNNFWTKSLSTNSRDTKASHSSTQCTNLLCNSMSSTFVFLDAHQGRQRRHPYIADSCRPTTIIRFINRMRSPYQENRFYSFVFRRSISN